MRARFATPDFQLGMTLGSFGFYVAGVGAIIVVLAEELGLPVSSLSWMGSIMGVGLFIGAVLGPMVLRLGPHATVAGATLGSGVGIVLIAIGQTLPVVAVGAALQAIAGAGIMLVIPTVLTGPNAESRITRVNAVASVVGVLAPLVIGLFITAGIGGRNALLLAAPTLFLAGIVALRKGWNVEEVSVPPADEAAAPARTLAGTPTRTETGESLHRSARATRGVARPTRGAARTALGGGVVVGTVVRRWLAVALAISSEFSFVIWAVARLVDSGLDAGRAAAVGSAFPIGMAVGRVLGPWVIARVPAVPVGAGLAAAGTVLVVVTDAWPVIGLGLLLAGLGIATLYPVTLVRLMTVRGLRPELASSLGTLAAGTAMTLAPAGLAALGGVVELRFAYLVVLPLLGALVVLHGTGGARPRARKPELVSST